MKKYILYLLLPIGLITGVLLAKLYYEPSNSVKEEQVALMLEKVKNVFKITTVEGQVSEIFSHKEHYGYNIFPFRKEMLIRAVAKVSVGYDLDSIKIDIDQKSKRIYLSSFGEPRILSVDHDLDYYDIKQGLFNNFSPKDYTEIQNKIKAMLKEKANNVTLFQKAEEQKMTIIESLNELASFYGWSIELQEEEKLRD